MGQNTPKVYATYGRTESGDDLPIFLYHEPPTEEQVLADYKKIMPEEFYVEDGEEGHYLWPEVCEATWKD